MLDAVLGQVKAKSFLLPALESRHFPSAYLFRGPRGVGKRSAALEFARLVQCEQLPQEPCVSCHKARALSHPDIRVYKPEGDVFPVALVREVREESRYRPFLGKLKVIILEDVDAWTPEAAGASLKMLEEPTASTLFILLQESSSLLPTIESRCVVVPFYHLGKAEIRDALARKYNGDFENEAALAMGILEDGEEFAWNGPLASLREEAFRIFQGLMSSKLGDLGKLEKAMGKDKVRLRRTLLFFQEFLRDIWILKGGTDSAVRNVKLAADLKSQSSRSTKSLFYLSNRISQLLLVLDDTQVEVQVRAFLSAVLYVLGHAEISR